jgi:hypothetical protein
VARPLKSALSANLTKKFLPIGKVLSVGFSNTSAMQTRFHALQPADNTRENIAE